MVRHARVVGIKGQRLLQPERTTASASSRFAGSVSKSSRTTRTEVSGRIAITSLGAAAQVCRVCSQSPSGRLRVAKIRLHQIGNHHARRQLARRCYFHHAPGIGSAAGEDAIGSDFAGERRTANVFGDGVIICNSDNIPSACKCQSSYLGEVQERGYLVSYPSRSPTACLRLTASSR